MTLQTTFISKHSLEPTQHQVSYHKKRFLNKNPTCQNQQNPYRKTIGNTVSATATANLPSVAAPSAVRASLSPQSQPGQNCQLAANQYRILVNGYSTASVFSYHSEQTFYSQSVARSLQNDMASELTFLVVICV